MPSGHIHDMKELREIAERNIRELLDLALKIFHKDRELARRYVDMAFRIAMKTRTRIPKEYKRLVCRKCRNLLIPGVNCRVRLQPRREPHVVVTCLNCGRIVRYLIKRRRKSSMEPLTETKS
ncbi:ribonuclease P [Candidatus Bathyarchaeota archaeon]|nr:ribonuclease P [Candidatus Bathyarchaeota archaeon]